MPGRAGAGAAEGAPRLLVELGAREGRRDSEGCGGPGGLGAARVRLDRGLALVFGLLELSACGSPPGRPLWSPPATDASPASARSAPPPSPAASTPPSPPPGVEPAGEPTAPGLPPLPGDAFERLAVPGHGDAVVALPLGATAKRPLLVVTHGAGGTPERHCENWRALLAGRVFVVCPRGAAVDRRAPPERAGYYYPDHLALGRELEAVLDAFGREARYAPYVDLERPAYAGFSQGATMGALALPGLEVRFARLALVEGGFGGSNEWSARSARALARAGTERVLLACGRSACADRARATASLLRREGLEARVLHAEGAGHAFAPMAGAIAGAVGWLFESDPRWLVPEGEARGGR